MEAVEKVTQKLDSFGVEYIKMEHPPVITSADAARIRKTDIGIGAKALIFIADGTPLMIVVPGDKKVSSGDFKRTYGIKDFRMANEQELMETTGLEKGAVPPLGSVFGIQSYFDESIKTLEKVAFNAGSRSVSVEMSAQDLIKVEKPIFGNFSKV